MQHLDALADSRIRDDRKPRKCSRCFLTTFDPLGVCGACQTLPAPETRWYGVAVSPSKLKCVLCKHDRQAVAVEHGLQGMTGRHACTECVRRLRLRLHVKDGGNVSNKHSHYKLGKPPSHGFRRAWRLTDKYAA